MVQKQGYVESYVKLLHYSLSASEVIKLVQEPTMIHHIFLLTSLYLWVKIDKYIILGYQVQSSLLHFESHDIWHQQFADILHPIVTPRYLHQTGKPSPNIRDELHIHVNMVFVKVILSQWVFWIM